MEVVETLVRAPGGEGPAKVEAVEGKQSQESSPKNFLSEEGTSWGTHAPVWTSQEGNQVIGGRVRRPSLESRSYPGKRREGGG